MNEAEREQVLRNAVAKAQRAQEALDEFFAPVIADIRADYLQKLIDVSTKEFSRNARSDKQTALSTALKVVDGFSNILVSIIKDGETAAAEIHKAERRLGLTGPARRLLDIAPR